jgi:Mn2+/Fe2+ NRAMP family transporter
MKSPSKISSVILWSVISAAFIGPGTITTAVTAGSQFQIQLLWAVVFATIACIILQEASARITIASGLSLGKALEKKFGHQRGFWIKLFIGGSVLLGCAAYEAGNILGAVSGMNLLIVGDGKIYTVLVTLCAALLLWDGRQAWISTLMTILVGMMGLAFFVLALYGDFELSDLLIASIVPRIPAGSELITLGLVGTTIVPYNLFLGSGISKGQTIPLMRIGLTVSVLIGGLITIWILLAGTVVGEFSSFQALAEEFRSKIGSAGVLALGVGLFAAGFSSAITSPYAASIIASNVFGIEKRSSVRIVWEIVLMTGFLFGMSGVKPIPVILAVQALNGLILPLITVYLIIILNDSGIIPSSHRPSFFYNLILLLILGGVLLIGLNNVDKSISTVLSLANPSHLNLILTLTGLLVTYVGFLLWKGRVTSR